MELIGPFGGAGQTDLIWQKNWVHVKGLSIENYFSETDLEHDILSHFNGMDGQSSGLMSMKDSIKLEDYLLPMEDSMDVP